MKAISSILMLVGRWCLAAIFAMGVVHKIISYDETVQYMAAHGFTMIPLFLVGAAIIEFFGALFLFLGYKARFGAFILMLFLIPTTLIFHSFWMMTGAERSMEEIYFLSNLAIFGGLLYVLACGAGSISLDACCKGKEPEAS